MERTQLERLAIDTGVAERYGDTVFLRDPYWNPTQREAFARIAQSKLANPQSAMDLGWFAIATGGSSGGLRFARHDEETLGAAAHGFATHFELPRINAVDVLPPWHVSGFMARVRCAVTGGRHVPWTWKQLEAGELPVLSAREDWVLSLVPTQLQRLLVQPPAVLWLQRLRLILIGGAPVWPDLVEATLAARLPAVLSYGMTETAAMVAAQLPADFAGGDSSSGRTMPQARISIHDEHSGQPLPMEQAGAIRIAGASVMRGYVGEPPVNGVFNPADLGWLHITGRRDDIIITGGEKVNPREIETVLRATGCFDDLAIIGLPHPEWGEEVTACYVPVDSGFDPFADDHLVSCHLPRHHRPKHWVRFNAADWPRNAQGKVNRADLKAAALALRNPLR